MIAWIKSTVIEVMKAQATQYQPNETGGCVLGYWANPLQEVIITEIIGPGPKARHCKSRFEPDHDWQTEKIAKIYKASGYLHSYLGDWHSHPNYASTKLSWRDRKTLRGIASYAPARIPFPLMAILAKGESWILNIWCLGLKDFKIMSIGKKREFKQIRIYE